LKERHHYLLLLLANVFLNTAEIRVVAEIIDTSKMVKSKIKSCLVSALKAYLLFYIVMKNLCDISLDNVGHGIYSYQDDNESSC
jgi:hypothetical protein